LGLHRPAKKIRRENLSSLRRRRERIEKKRGKTSLPNLGAIQKKKKRVLKRGLELPFSGGGKGKFSKQHPAGAIHKTPLDRSPPERAQAKAKTASSFLKTEKS